MSCRQLALAGRFLANAGRISAAGGQIVSAERVRRINALMLTCGHYDGSGDFAFRVGLPGKSGVGGAILAVAPRAGLDRGLVAGPQRASATRSWARWPWSSWPRPPAGRCSAISDPLPPARAEIRAAQAGILLDPESAAARPPPAARWSAAAAGTGGSPACPRRIRPPCSSPAAAPAPRPASRPAARCSRRAASAAGASERSRSMAHPAAAGGHSATTPSRPPRRRRRDRPRSCRGRESRAAGRPRPAPAPP